MPANEPQLRDIHVPSISPWWPLAPGWWGLLALVVLGLVVLVIVLRRRAAWRRHVDAVLGDLRQARARHAADGDVAAFAAVASQLLRRVARTRDPRSVTLSGEAWRAALAGMAPKRDVARLVALDAALYRRDIALDVDATVHDIEAWVRAAMRRPATSRMRRAPSHAAA